MKYLQYSSLTVLVLCLCLMLTACGGEPNTPDGSGSGDAGTSGDDTAATASRDALFLSVKQTEAQPILQAITASTMDTPVAVTGKVGEIIAGRAAFRLVDASMEDCTSCESGCETPWDY